jgi:hypothetical protein
MKSVPKPTCRTIPIGTPNCTKYILLLFFNQNNNKAETASLTTAEVHAMVAFFTRMDVVVRQ